MSDQAVKLGTQPHWTLSDMRDAVHVPIVSCVAAERLRPGQRVGRFYDDESKIFGTVTANGTSAKVIGIVDPFLDRDVMSGESFWLCLLPGTVTSLVPIRSPCI